MPGGHIETFYTLGGASHVPICSHTGGMIHLRGAEQLSGGAKCPPCKKNPAVLYSNSTRGLCVYGYSVHYVFSDVLTVPSDCGCVHVCGCECSCPSTNNVSM